MPLPLRSLTRHAVVFAAWTAFGLLLALQTAFQLRLLGQARSAWSIFAPAVIGMWLWALYTPGLVRVVRTLRRLRERSGSLAGRWARFLGAHLGVAAVVAAADAALWGELRPLVDGTVLPWSRVFAVTLLVNVAAYVAVVAITESVDYAARWRERERAAAALARTAEELRGQLQEARLHALEAQLRPHFLYNTLNLIAELVHEEPEAADAMLTRLGALLRLAYQDAPHLVPLREELAFATAYAEILTQRYRDRVLLTVDVPDVLLDHPVPLYALQPLVENAFRHGVEHREGPSAVEIGAAAEAGRLVLRVRDRALGARAHARGEAPVRESATLDPRHAGSGVGLRNTRERLAALYGEAAAGVRLTRLPDDTTALVWLPLAVWEGWRADGQPMTARRAQEA